MAQKKQADLTYIDLFCGAGGLALGFEKAGFKNIFSLDNEPNFCKTYRANFPNHTLIQSDISKIDAKEIKKILKKQHVDVVIGGPPCQGFSMAGSIGRKFIADPRNRLFREFARVIKIIEPEYFVMENVARLYSHNKGQTRAEIIECFSNLGYTVSCTILNAAEYDVPQSRRRVIFVGTKSDLPFAFSKEKTNRIKTVWDAIHDLPTLEVGASSVIPNHEAMRHTPQMLKKMAYVKDGGDRSQIPLPLRPLTGDSRKYIRYTSTEPSVCVTGDMRKIFHYSQNRALTVRELARIQSFPDSFVFTGSKISQQQQVGNAVPPLLAKMIAQRLKKVIRNEK
ncbi:MAG: DNA (cytosine-5-)-methyltransferase [Candidatus Kaiserbacteria bacterium]|nr:DNA (cytosine-5-)-methyltransferase [Candidatus Kaiserbacteria bacterium]